MHRPAPLSATEPPTPHPLRGDPGGHQPLSHSQARGASLPAPSTHLHTLAYTLVQTQTHAHARRPRLHTLPHTHPHVPTRTQTPSRVRSHPHSCPRQRQTRRPSEPPRTLVLPHLGPLGEEGGNAGGGQGQGLQPPPPKRAAQLGPRPMLEAPPSPSLRPPAASGGPSAAPKTPSGPGPPETQTLSPSQPRFRTRTPAGEQGPFPKDRRRVPFWSPSRSRGQDPHPDPWAETWGQRFPLPLTSERLRLLIHLRPRASPEPGRTKGRGLPLPAVLAAHHQGAAPIHLLAFKHRVQPPVHQDEAAKGINLKRECVHAGVRACVKISQYSMGRRGTMSQKGRQAE